eukprot:6442430-Prymnesium_polylepis.1
MAFTRGRWSHGGGGFGPWYPDGGAVCAPGLEPRKGRAHAGRLPADRAPRLGGRRHRARRYVAVDGRGRRRVARGRERLRLVVAALGGVRRELRRHLAAAARPVAPDLHAGTAPVAPDLPTARRCLPRGEARRLARRAHQWAGEA